MAFSSTPYPTDNLREREQHNPLDFSAHSDDNHRVDTNAPAVLYPSGADRGNAVAMVLKLKTGAH